MTVTVDAVEAPNFLTVEEVAELFGRDAAGKLRLSQRSVYRHHKQIPGAVRFGARLLFRRPPLMAWVDGVKGGDLIPFSRGA